jgi:hypothetical protein
MQTGLAEAWRSRVAGQAAESDERLEAEYNLAVSLVRQGRAAKAEAMFRGLHEVMKRVHGAEHPNTLSVAGNLALCLSNHGKHAEAERIQREVHGVRKRVHGAEHPHTLSSAGCLALSLSKQGKYADAERIQREVLGVQTRVHGAEHPSTLTSAGNLALSLLNQGKHAEAERIEREVLGVQTRVRSGGMRIGGGEQRVLSILGGAVLLAPVPAHGLEGAQAGVHGGTAMSVGESPAAMPLEEAWSWQVEVYHPTVARGEEELARSSRWVIFVQLCANVSTREAA